MMESLHHMSSRFPDQSQEDQAEDEKRDLEELVAEAEQHSQNASLVAYSSSQGSMHASAVSNEGSDATPGDVYTQLAQKEKDLVLAAELGKALLEKNEDLSRQNEKIAEEFSHRLEVGIPCVTTEFS